MILNSSVMSAMKLEICFIRRSNRRLVSGLLRQPESTLSRRHKTYL